MLPFYGSNSLAHAPTASMAAGRLHPAYAAQGAGSQPCRVHELLLIY